VVDGVTPAGTVLTSTEPPKRPSAEAVALAGKLTTPPPKPPDQKLAELDRLIELSKQLPTLPAEDSGPIREAIKKLVDGL
jgi:hypothetical protein